MDPTFYTIIALFFIISIFIGPILFFISDLIFGAIISKPFWIILGALIIVINVLYFSQKKVKEIHIKFKEENIQARNVKYSFILFGIIIIVIFLILK